MWNLNGWCGANRRNGIVPTTKSTVWLIELLTYRRSPRCLWAKQGNNGKTDTRVAGGGGGLLLPSPAPDLGLSCCC